MRRILAVVAAFVCVAFVGASWASQKVELTVYTGSGPGSVYFAVGSMLAKVLNDKGQLVSAKGVTSGASVANIRAIDKGDAHLAIAQNDVTYYAWKGIVRFKEPIKTVRGIATMWPEPVQIVVRADSPIRKLEDLAGKRVVVGAAGSGVEAAASAILKAAGLWDKITKINQSFEEAAQSFTLGQVDANIAVIAYPAPAINMIDVQVPVRLIPIPDEIVKKLHAEGYPFYVKVRIPKGTYKGMDSDVETIAVKSTLVCHKDLSPEVVYEVTKMLFTNTEELAKAHQVANQIKISGALEGMQLPLHPGAIKFYEENGIKVPAELRM